MSAGFDRGWVGTHAESIVAGFDSELEALVAVSSPSGDVEGAERMCALVGDMLPAGASVERPACSSPGFAPDLLATITGKGQGRVLLLGHLDTVIAHDEHRPLERADGRLIGSGSVDMKGGDVFALGVMRALAATADAFGEVGLLLVVDEEWRTGGFSHGPRFAGWDACLCFEGAQFGPDGDEALVAKRKAAATILVHAHGVAAHAGSAPEKGRNALVALGEVAARVAAASDPHGDGHLTAVPTVIRSGGAFNVVPATGELVCDVRADSLEATAPAIEAIPAEIDGVRIEAEWVRQWPGMDTRDLVEDRLLGQATALSGTPLVASQRGGASDASHMAGHVALTVDGLGPHGGHAHHPDEYVDTATLRGRAQIALAVAAAALGAI
jgi:glutamate carboxypeptidase